MKHSTLATARLYFLFLAARIWRHFWRVGVSYSDHYQKKTSLPAVHGASARSNPRARWVCSCSYPSIDRSRLLNQAVHN